MNRNIPFHFSFFTYKMLKLLCPSMYVTSVTDIDTALLKERGYGYIMIDLDNTLLPWGEIKFSPEVVGWVEKTISRGFKMCIVSNASGKRVKFLSEKLGVPFIYYAGKPCKGGFLRGLNLMNGNIERSVVIGDQIFTDILGGNRAGIMTVLVRPVKKKELFTTRIMREFEKMAIYLLKRRGFFPEL